MQPTSPLTMRENLYLLIAGILASLLTAAGGIAGILVKGLLDRRKEKAHVVQIAAGSVKIEAEAKEVTNRIILDAQERIVELVEINSELQSALVEAERLRDNFEFELRDERFKKAQMSTEMGLDKQFIEKLTIANKLGITLEKMPTDHIALSAAIDAQEETQDEPQCLPDNGSVSDQN